MKIIDLTQFEGFNWDINNIDKNWLSHRVSWQETEEVFFNEDSYIFKDELHSEKEERYGIVGVTKNNRKLSVAFTIRNNKIRVITARDQSHKERKFYENYKKNTTI